MTENAEMCVDEPEPVEIIVVTPAMERAGLERARELVGQPPTYVVSAIYLAMEYERLGGLGKLSRLGDKTLKIR